MAEGRAFKQSRGRVAAFERRLSLKKMSQDYGCPAQLPPYSFGANGK